MATGTAASTFLVAHENRIQDLETGQADLAVSLAHQTSDLEHLQAQVAEQVLPTLKTIAEDVAAGRTENAKWFTGLDGRLTTLEQVKRAEDEAAKAAVERKKLWVSRIAAPVLLLLGGAAGAVASKFGEAIWAYITA